MSFKYKQCISKNNNKKIHLLLSPNSYIPFVCGLLPTCPSWLHCPTSLTCPSQSSGVPDSHPSHPYSFLPDLLEAGREGSLGALLGSWWLSPPLLPSPQPSLLEEGVFCGCEDRGLGGRAIWEVWRVGWTRSRSIQDQG